MHVKFEYQEDLDSYYGSVFSIMDTEKTKNQPSELGNVLGVVTYNNTKL